jgi:hypothetical protein
VDAADRIGDRVGVAAAAVLGNGADMEVLRWLLFFAIAMFLIVAGIFFVLGKPLPIPNF